MKDKFNEEIVENQIVSQVNHKNPSLAIVRGGFTQGRQVRLISLDVCGRKSISKPQHLVVLSNQQSIRLARGIIETRQAKIESHILNLQEYANIGNDDNLHRVNYLENRIDQFNEQIEQLNTFIDIANQRIAPGNHINFEDK